MCDTEKIDAGRALDLLWQAVGRYGGHTVGAAHGGILAAALSATAADESRLARLGHDEIRTLWVDNRLPLPMTLGAVVVFNRAQRLQWAGATWRAAVESATQSAQLLVGLIPLRACASAVASERS